MRHCRPRIPDLRARMTRRGQSVVEFALILPVLLVLTIAIADFGRVFACAIGVESAAREAADYGAFLTHGAWDETNGAQISANYAEMARRACTALSDLPGYVGTTGNSDCGEGGTPYYSFDIVRPPGVTNCGDQSSLADEPCLIHATVTLPFSAIIQFPPLPSSITLTRQSWFAVSDFG
jgi:hypothetical protein